MGLSGLIRPRLIHDRNLLELVWLMLADWVYLALFAALMGLALWRGAHFFGLRRRRDDLISISIYFPCDIGSINDVFMVGLDQRCVFMSLSCLFETD